MIRVPRDELEGQGFMNSGPPVKRVITFDADTWDRLGRLATEQGSSPEELVARVAARIELSPGGDLEVRPRS